VLAIDQLAVGLHVEDAAGALDQAGFEAQPLLERGRQTGGLGLVVSLTAIRDGDVHVALRANSTRTHAMIGRTLGRGKSEPVKPVCARDKATPAASLDRIQQVASSIIEAISEAE
jgi:hypothetical protein